MTVLSTNGFFLTDLFACCWFNFALFAVALGVVRVAGVQESGRAQWEVTGASEIGNLLSIEITAHSTGNVTEFLISEDDDAFSIEGNVLTGGFNLNTTIWHFPDAGNIIVALG